MSNYLAIATVTAILQRTLQASVQADVDGARVTTVRPESVGGAVPETGVNLYLYYLAPNPAWRNADLRTRYSDGQYAKRPQAALDLHYLITCYGNEVELEPQRLMGSVVRTLHAQPILTGPMILDAIDAPTFPFLRESNLVDQIESIKLMPLPISTDELSNIWSVFFQTPYSLSIAYQAGVVLIESDNIPTRPLPVRERKFTITPNQPVVEQVVAASGDRDPILSNSTLVVRGQRLRNEITQLRLGAVDLPLQQITATEIRLDLSTVPAGTLRSGVQSLQVIHRQASDLVRSVESNVVPFVLLPRITQVRLATIEALGDDEYNAEMVLTLDPPLGRGQRAILALNARSTQQPRAYTFDAIKREFDREPDRASDRATSEATVTIPVRAVKAGEYLVRVQIDGAESRLQVDTDRQSPTFEQFIGPLVTLPERE